MMKRLILYAVALAFLFSGCRKDDSTVISVEEESEPEEVELVLLKGKVMNQGSVLLPNTEIQIIQDREILGTTYTNEDGAFEFLFPHLADRNAFVRASHGEYTDSWSRVESSVADGAEMTMMMSNAFLFSGGFYDSLLMTEVAFLTGQLVDEAEMPVEQRLLLLNTARGVAGYSFTSPTGAFTMVVPVNTRGDLVALEQFCLESEVLQFVTIEEMDIDLDMVAIDESDKVPTQINGQVLDCDGNPISTAIVVLAIGDIPALRVLTDENGNFEFDFLACADGMALTVFAFDESGNEATTTVQFDTNSGTFNLGSFTICAEFNLNQKIEVIIEGDTISFENQHFFVPAEASLNRTAFIYPHYNPIYALRRGLSLTFRGASIGEDFPISNIGIEYAGGEYAGGSDYGRGTSGTATITAYSNEAVEGTFEAEILDTTTGELVAASGSFYVEIE